MAPLILVIDDDLPILQLYQMLFEMEGYRVQTLPYRVETAQEIAVFGPDLILTDFKLQRTPAGPDLWHLLRMHPSTAHIPLMVCTAAVVEVHAQAAVFQQHGISLVYKPFDLETLLAIVRDCLAQAAQASDEA